MVDASLGVAEASTSAWSGPLRVQGDPGMSLDAWAADRRAWIDEQLLTHGAILFSGFAVGSPADFRRVAEGLCGALLDYTYRSTPRTTVGQSIYTATEYRADASIPMHNENAYQRDWPMRLVFCCTQPAASGGETPLARSASVTRRIDPAIVRLFAERGVMYVRNYTDGIDLSWQTVFQTESRAEVETFCRRESIEWTWLPGNCLRTRQVCQGVAQHPRTGETLWFNQAHLFHVSSLGAEIAAEMLDLFGEAGLPRNAYLGDGSRIDESVLAHIGTAYEAEAFAFPWQRGDVLLVDNMLVAHSRTPYRGERKVLVAMARPFSEWTRPPAT